MQQCRRHFLRCSVMLPAHVRACQMHLWYGGQSVSEMAWAPNGIRCTEKYTAKA